MYVKYLICDTCLVNDNLLNIFIMQRIYGNRENIYVQAVSFFPTPLNAKERPNMENKSQNDFSGVVFQYKKVSVQFYLHASTGDPQPECLVS